MGRAGWRSFVRGSTTRLKTVAESKLAVKDDHCIPQPHVYKLLTDCILICLCGALKTIYVSISSKLQQWLLIFFFCLMLPQQPVRWSHCINTSLGLLQMYSFERIINWMLFKVDVRRFVFHFKQNVKVRSVRSRLLSELPTILDWPKLKTFTVYPLAYVC